MSDTTRTRRSVLATLTWAAGLSVAPPLASALRTEAQPRPAAADLAAALQFLIFRFDAVSRIGAAYRREHPEESHPGRLRELTMGSLPEDDARSATAITQRLAVRVQRDFAAGDTVRIDGWVLARTEARLCALFA